MIEITYCMMETKQNKRKKPVVREEVREGELQGQHVRIHYLILPWWALEQGEGRLQRRRREKLLKILLPLLTVDTWMETRLYERFPKRQPELTAPLILWRLQRYGERQAVVLAERENPDSEDRILYRELLEKLYPGLNYLTVIGAGKEAYEDLAEHIYGDSGLVLRCLEKAVPGYPYGKAPLILNFGERKNISPACMPADSLCVHMQAEMPKFLDTIAKNGYTNLVMGVPRENGGV